MDIKELLEDKAKKAKEKTEILSQWLLHEPPFLLTLMEYAAKAKDPDKASCIEAIEWATRIKPGIATKVCLAFVGTNLSAKAPRVKWESAKVIANIAPLFPGSMKSIVPALLNNSEHPGTVVRWSAAYALAAITKLNTGLNKELVPAMEAICLREEKNSIRKIYQEAIGRKKQPACR